MFGRVAYDKLARQLDWLWPDIGLRRKIAVLVVAGTLSLIGLFAMLGAVALQQSTARVLQDRLVLAQATAGQIDEALAYVENVLCESAAPESWSDPEQAEASLARTLARLDQYATRVFLTDGAGHVIASVPSLAAPLDLSHFSAVSQALDGHPFQVSSSKQNLNSFASTVAAVPVMTSTGSVTHVLVAGIDLDHARHLSTVQSAYLGDGGYVDLVDLAGRVLASTFPERVDLLSDPSSNFPKMILVHQADASAGHPCFGAPPASECRELVAFAPLDRAPWGIAVRQREDQALAGLNSLMFRLFGLMVVGIIGDLALVYVTTRAVIRPVQTLTAASRRIAAGDLDTPIPTGDKDELGRLTRAFEFMRLRLADWNHALNKEVEIALAESRAALKQNAMLYAELQEKERVRRELLHRVFSAQEEERKRISRELHDETCQILNSLAYALDNVGEMVEQGQATSDEIQPMLEKMRALAKTGRDGVSRIIFDLRPTMLDHLGLVPALRWYAETRLADCTIHYAFHESGQPRRLRPSVETALFRVVQEAVNNIGEHSGARRADFFFDYAPDHITVRVVDDGRGFNRAAVEQLPGSRRGLGLMGMEERMTAVGGVFHLQSADGQGTVVQLNVPLAFDAGANHEQDPGPGSG